MDLSQQERHALAARVRLGETAEKRTDGVRLVVVTAIWQSYIPSHLGPGSNLKESRHIYVLGTHIGTYVSCRPHNVDLSWEVTFEGQATKQVGWVDFAEQMDKLVMEYLEKP